MRPVFVLVGNGAEDSYLKLLLAKARLLGVKVKVKQRNQ